MISANSLPRLMHRASGRPLSLAEHDQEFGSANPQTDFLSELRESGLTGRGGAGFPTYKKVELLSQQRGHGKFVVVNAMEGEPASHKDLALLNANPHLVIDGAEMLAHMIGAKRIAICVSRDNPIVINNVNRALHERTRRSLRGPEIELHTPPWRYVAGEESALVHWLDDNESLPQYRPQRPTILRIGHNAALVDNAETCANVGLIGRYGANWYRQLGTESSPGSTLVSVTGAVERAHVIEIALGTPVKAILEVAGADTDPQAILLGGYGGTWLSGDNIRLPFATEYLKEVGASVGAGIIMVLPRRACGLMETYRITKWMANESARQCGPCAFGLPALAEDLQQLVLGGKDRQQSLDRLICRAAEIDGRGACKHPDGVVRMVRTALKVFEKDLANHINGAPCVSSRDTKFYATVPKYEREEDLVWE